MNFQIKSPHYEHLRKKWGAKNKDITQNLFDKHLRNVAISSLGGLMLLTTPSFTAGKLINEAEQGSSITSGEDKNIFIKEALEGKLPKEVRSLTFDEEKEITGILSDKFGFKIAAGLDGKRLDRSYGLIGGEQHLYRYPGDTLHAHSKTTQDWAMFGSSGIAPGLGAWGYFSPSKEEFTPQDEERERWYIAVQTFMAPGFSERVGEYRDFFKFRKMLLINPDTGQSVVTDVGDAGPAVFTGKHLGGSPEVMHELGLASGPRKGDVLYFFVDDPNDQIPLGPVKALGRENLAKN